MYAYLSGALKFKSPTHVIIETGGVGYEVQISLNTYSRIESLETVTLWTQLIVREDSHTLFGFFGQDEKVLFNNLISVSGIGPNTARLILSGMTPVDVNSAILAEDDLSFKKVKGVGPKTAKRLIVELKDKISKAADTASLQMPAGRDNTSRLEALSALETLGFQKSQIQKAMSRVQASMSDTAVAEDWIKAALKELSG